MEIFPIFHSFDHERTKHDIIKSKSNFKLQAQVHVFKTNTLYNINVGEDL